ncbi:MAG: hypothetical protein ACE5KG_03080 [Nitrososphaerales archaeon]
MEPLGRLNEAQSGLPNSIIKKTRDRFRFVTEGVKRVEEASGLPYPQFYVEPVLSVSSTSLELGKLGIMYARTIPVEHKGKVEIVIQLSVPLIVFGIKSTIQAVVAHEFMHYIEFVRKFSTMDVLSEESASTLFEAPLVDMGRLFSAKELFKDKRLAENLNKKFRNGLHDTSLNEKTLKRWIDKGLPSKKVGLDANRVNLPIKAIVETTFPSEIVRKIREADSGLTE